MNVLHAVVPLSRKSPFASLFFRFWQSLIKMTQMIFGKSVCKFDRTTRSVFPNHRVGAVLLQLIAMCIPAIVRYCCVIV